MTRSVPSNDNVGGVMTRLTRNGRVTVRICKTNSAQLPDETFDRKKKKEKNILNFHMTETNSHIPKRSDQVSTWWIIAGSLVKSCGKNQGTDIAMQPSVRPMTAPISIKECSNDLACRPPNEGSHDDAHEGMHMD